MAETYTIIIGAADTLPALRERMGDANGAVLVFSDLDAIDALNTITTRRASLVVLERLFAMTTRGAALINRDGMSVWIDVPLDRLIARVPPDGRRPLAADRAEFERLYLLRRESYEHAHHRIDASRASIDAIVEQLLDWLQT